MYRIGVVGHRPEYVPDHNSTIRNVDRVVDLISYQYGKDLVLNVNGDIGVGQWTLEACENRKIKYHLFLPCEPEAFAENWYEKQKDFLHRCFKNAWAVSIYAQKYNLETEREVYRQIVSMSDFLICFWNGMSQGPTFDCIKYALENHKLTLNGLNDLKLITNEDMRRKIH